MTTMVENAFVDLRRLLDWFQARPKTVPRHIFRVTERLGARSIPLLCRELCGKDDMRREAARSALLNLAADVIRRPHVIRALRSIAASDGDDREKLAALGLLSELGDRTTARFADPIAVQRSSATAFAAALNGPVDIATAADLIVHQLSSRTVTEFLAVMAEVDPDRTARLARELCCRHEVSPELREQIAEFVPLAATAGPSVGMPSRPARVTVLTRDEVPHDDHHGATNRVVVVATRKLANQRQWRLWAVLISSLGHIDDCIHEETSDDADGADLIQRLVRDGYRLSSTEHGRACSIVSEAARRTIARKAAAPTLPAPYYIGRDLLDLGDAHLTRPALHPAAVTLSRAIHLIAAGDISTAREWLARCDSHDPDVVAADATCLLMQGQFSAAAKQLRQAISLEPTWPLHHWNMSVALYQLHDLKGCRSALQQFLTTSSTPSGLYADPDQGGRVARAVELIAVLDRTTRLASWPPRCTATRA